MRAGLEVLGDHVEVRREREERGRGPRRCLAGRWRRCACRGCCAGRWRRRRGPRGRSSPAASRGPTRRVGGSTFTTSAPSRASSCVAYGSACICSAASTRTPSSGLPYCAAPSFATSPSRTSRPFVAGREQGTPLRLTPRQAAWSTRYPAPHARHPLAGRPTCRSDGSIAPRSRPSSVRAAARAPARSPPSTRTPPRWRSRPRAWRCAAATLDARRSCCSRPRFPAYADKTNATAIHAALRLDRTGTRASTSAASVRAGRRRAAARPVRERRAALVVAADVRTGLPGSGDESAGGDAAAAFVVGDDADGPVVAEFLGRRASPRSSSSGGAPRAIRRTRVLGRAVRRDQLRAPRRAGLERGAGVGGAHRRRRRRRRGRRTGCTRGRRAAVGGKLDGVHVIDDLSATRRQHRAPRSRACCSPRCSSRPSPGRCSRSSCWPTAPTCCCSAPPTRSALVPTVPVGRRAGRGGRPAAVRQVPRRGGACCRWSRRAGPSRSACRRRPRRAARNGSSGSSVRRSVTPGSSTSRRRACRATATHTDDMDPAPLADVRGTIVTFTIDRMAYSPSPPIVFAVVDFDGGGRPAARAHRRRRRRGRDRPAGGDDVPPAVHAPTASSTTSGRAGWSARCS